MARGTRLNIKKRNFYYRKQINQQLESIQCNEEGSQTVKYRCPPTLEIEGKKSF